VWNREEKGRRKEKERRGKGAATGREKEERKEGKKRGGGIRSKGFAPFVFDMWHKDLPFYFKHYTFYKLL
jgi:hypothetical protein